jgi:pimeloyl-ACP methyl ester carboxylesterase
VPGRLLAGGRRGDGPGGLPIAAPRPILIHGSGGDHRVWALQSARLAGSIAVDLPGHPEGTPLTTVEELAAAMVPAVESIPGPRALVGHSLGGAVALELAIARPDLVQGAVAIASGARLTVPDAAMARAEEDFAAERDRLLQGFFADPDAPMAGRAREALDRAGRGTLLADYAACRSVDLRGRLGAVRAPVLVICGGDDPLTPPHRGEELARELPMCRMMVIPRARHMPMAEFDETLNLWLAAYLARLELTLDGM